MMSIRIASGLLLLLSIAMAIVIFGQSNSCDLVIVGDVCLGGNIKKVINARGTELEQSRSGLYYISATKEFPIRTRIFTNAETGVISRIILNCNNKEPSSLCQKFFTKIAETNNIEFFQGDSGEAYNKGHDTAGYTAQLQSEYRWMTFKINRHESERKQ